MLGSRGIYASVLYRAENKCLSKNWMSERMTLVFGKFCFNDSTVTILWQLLLKIPFRMASGGMLGDVQS